VYSHVVFFFLAMVLSQHYCEQRLITWLLEDTKLGACRDSRVYIDSSQMVSNGRSDTWLDTDHDA
jgi:hypothetical protein